jgi:hypothetical protein
VGASLLRGTRTLADVKTKSCDDKYPAEREDFVVILVYFSSLHILWKCSFEN